MKVVNMDWDELILRKPSPSHQIGEPLENLAIGELEARIKDLESEINRVNAEILKKRAHSSLADSFFKK